MPVILLSAILGGVAGFASLMPNGFFVATLGASLGGSIAALLGGVVVAQVRRCGCRRI